MEKTYIKNSEFLKALAHPVRLKMVAGLLCHECNVDKMVKGLGIPQSTVSQHLALLRNKGILVMRKEGVKTCYCVKDGRIARLLKILGD